MQKYPANRQKDSKNRELILEKLKLKAEDVEDLTILSAYLQDAITMMSDIVYLRENRRFVIMLNRYIWENRCPDTGDILPEKNTPCSRIRTGLHFDDVLNISSRNISTSLKEHPLELLSIEGQKLDDRTFHVDFIFSGNGVIRLDCEMISAHMQDIGDTWPAKCHPKHAILNALQNDNTG